MRYIELLEVTINNANGWGAVPNNQDIDYFGLRVMMAPSVFLKLAAKLGADANDKIKQHIKNGGAIGAPFLQINIPEEWDDGNFNVPAIVRTHEGRNRMTAILELEGDNPIEVHLFFGAGMRRRHITPAIIKELNSRLIPERKTESDVLVGPFFKLH